VVELVDTGGWGLSTPISSPSTSSTRSSWRWPGAELVLFVVDCQAGLTTADEADRRDAPPQKHQDRILVANKADGPKADVMLGDFARLGLGTPIGVSALNDRNIDQVIAAMPRRMSILSHAPTEIPAADDGRHRRQAQRRQEHAGECHRRNV
jgi:GTP-binding protein